MKQNLIKVLELMLKEIYEQMNIFAMNGINPDFLMDIRNSIDNTLKMLKGE